jgi:lipid-binding SYLF domain-containing protein
MKLRIFAMLALSAAFASAATDAEERLAVAAEAFKEVMSMADRAIPQELLAKAECVIIIPGLKKGAFIIGGQYGKGFATCRNANGVGWSAPGSVRAEGGSFGLQVGGSETDVFMLIMNKRGMDRLLSTKFTLGGEASAAAGPVGRTTQASTDAAMTAEILVWARSRGLFAGISLKGQTLREDKNWNNQLYGKKLSNRDIITKGVQPPAAAAALLRELNHYSSRK